MIRNADGSVEMDFAEFRGLPIDGAEHSEIRGAWSADLPDPQNGGLSRGRAGIKQAHALLTGGWADGAARLAEVARDLAANIPPAACRRRARALSADGDDLVIDRAMRGDWDRAWSTSRRVTASGPQIVSVVGMWGGRAHYSPADLFWGPAAAIVVAQVLETAGYAVDLSLGNYSVNCGAEDSIVTLVRVKDAGSPLDLASAAVFCHAGIFRTWGFLHKFTHRITEVGGSEAQWPASVARDPGTVYLDNAYSHKEATKQITRALTSLTGENK